MNKFYKNNYPETNLYKKMSVKSEMLTQMIYGDKFSILKTASKWLKIKIINDGYIGFIKKKKYIYYSPNTHKVSVLSANIYKNSNNKKKITELTYGSRIKLEERYLEFVRFENKWIDKKNIKPINFRNRKIFSNIKIFTNIRYKWGGKSFKGLDCSALIQLFFNFNNKYCPRDAKDQIRYFKKSVSLRNIKKNNIIYWRGHVAVAISKKKLIHAYGPAKKTIIMGIDQTIRLIKKTAKLKILSIKKI